MSYLRRYLTGLLFGTCAALNFGYLSVQTTQVCMDQTLLSTPAVQDTVYIDSIAWPIGSVVMPEPLLVNNQLPTTTSPQVLCMSGCSAPPCWPVASCPLSDLFWAARYTNLSVAPNFFMRLPDMPVGTTPHTLLVLFDTVAPSPSVTPTPSSSPSPSPSGSATPSPSARPPIPVPATQSSETPHATPAAIVFGILFGTASFILFGCWHWSQRPPCPFCEIRVAGAAVGMRTHLKTCKDHLALYQPFVLETVREIPQQQTVAVHVSAPVGDEKEDLIARPESVTGVKGK